MKKKLLLTQLLLFAFSNLLAQILTLDTLPPVFINGNKLQNAWTGGANSPDVAQIDLDGDGKPDLITYDKAGNRLSCYINIGQAGQAIYRYAPEYLVKFPADLNGWIRTYDFDCDGDLDLFTYQNAAIRVYKNEYTPVPGLSFTLFTNQINTGYGSIQSNLYVNTETVPAFADVDGDGDMDILSRPVSGNWVEYHKNYAMDSTGNCAAFLYHVQIDATSLHSEMWGHFGFSQFENKAILGQKANPDPLEKNLVLNKLEGITSTSGSVLWAFDYECDNDMDLLNGDLLGSNLLFLQNGAPPDSMIYQDSLFPNYNTPVQIESIACPSLMDIDNDGKNDLIITPLASGEDYNNVLLYNNQGDNCNPDFHLSTNRFLVDQMIDVGTSARLAFFDVDGDGLTEMLISNQQYYNNTNPSATYSRIAYYRNTGTSILPNFTLITTDYENCSSLGLYGLLPTFGDLDGDGDQDMVLGTGDGNLIYYDNTGGAGNPANFVLISINYQLIDVGSNSAPQLIDVDRDGLLDIVIGERTGNLNYYHNIGTASMAVFDVPNLLFGGVNVLQSNFFVGNSVPLLFDNNGSYELLVGSESGYIYHYNNIDSNIGGTFTLVDTAYQNIYEPSHAAIAMADVDGDSKFDLLVGCQAGGVRLYTQRNNIQNTEIRSDNDADFSLFPSPAADELNIRINGLLSSVIKLQIVDVLGNETTKISEITSSASSFVYKMDVRKLSAGIYFVRMIHNKVEHIKKFIKE